MIKIVPPPWNLKGRGFIIVLNEPLSNVAMGLFPNPFQKKSFLSFPMIMLVDYKETPVGPYWELLYIPGRFVLGGGAFWTISRIFVSTEESVFNGRENWGIPKELAKFSLTKEGTHEKIAVFYEEKLLAQFVFANSLFSLPVSTAFIPNCFLKFSQQYNKFQYTFSPQATGKLALANLVDVQCYGPDFIPFGKENVRLALEAVNFTLHFPVPSSIALS